LALLVFILHALINFVSCFLVHYQQRFQLITDQECLCSEPVLSNLFDTAGRIRINLEAAGRNSRPKLKGSD